MIEHLKEIIMPEKEDGQPTKDERTWAMLCHFSAFTGFIFPLGGNMLRYPESISKK